MTLKEKLCEPFGGLRNVTVNELEVIADEFAIDFAMWYEFMLRQNDNLNERFTSKKLLQDYKKEKGL